MPPAAISRSSTYFPKICGNIPTRENSALLGALLGAAVLTTVPACGSKEAVVTQVAIRAHDLVSCPLEPPADFELSLSALGPFRPGSGDTRSVGYTADAVFEFSPETAGLEAIATRSPELVFHGYTERRSDAGLDFLLWPSERACELHDIDTSRRYPNGGAGQALGFSAALGVVFVAGEDSMLAGGAQSALSFDANAGVVALQPAMLPMPTQRAYATTTPFGDGFLVAGGENPTSGEDYDDRQRWETAHTYSLESASFAADTIALQWDRSRHAALALDDGSSLLAGGIAQGGPVLQFEAVFPGSNVSSTIGLSALTVGRLEPALLRLSDGRLLVGGGYLPIGSPVGTLEWFSSDATERLAELRLPARPHRTFAALPGGGVLSVACAAQGPRDEPCGDEGFEGTWVTGENPPSVTRIEIPPASECAGRAFPLLVPGSSGRPWLVAVTDTNTPACLWTFDAWPERYRPSPDTPSEPWPAADALPRFEPSLRRLDPPPNPRVPPVSLGPDAFVWVTDRPGGGLAGARFGVRGSLSNSADSLVGGTASEPLHLAPDRAVPVDPSAGESVPHLYEPVGPDAIQELLLTPPEPGALPLSVWVTDALYEDFSVTLQLSLDADASTGATGAPALRYGGTLVGSASACPWPGLPAAHAETGFVTVSAVRRGSRVTLRGAENVECTVDSGPVSFGLRAPGDSPCAADGAVPCASRVRSLLVERD